MNAAELARLRSDTSDPELMPDTADVARATEVDTESGGSTTTWPNVVVGVPCRIEPAGLSSQEEILALRLAAVIPWTIAFPHGTDVQRKDRVTVGTQVFEVQAVLKGGRFELQRRVAATETSR